MKLRLSIRKKIFLGFLIICFILLLSGLVAIFEMSRLQRSMTGILSQKVETVVALHNIEATMLEKAGDLLYALPEDSFLKDATSGMDKIKEQMETVYKNTLTAEDSLSVATLALHLANFETKLQGYPHWWNDDYAVRRAWYVNNLYPAFLDVRQELSELTAKINKSMEATSAKIESGFYRSNIPAVIAVVVGIILVLLFNYFINLYFVSPVLRITKSARKYLSNRIKYQVEVESDDDLKALNEAVKNLIEEHQATVTKP